MFCSATIGLLFTRISSFSSKTSFAMLWNNFSIGTCSISDSSRAKDPASVARVEKSSDAKSLRRRRRLTQTQSRQRS